MKTPRKRSLWTTLVDRGLCEDRREAEALLLAGEFLVDGERFAKPGRVVSTDVMITRRKPAGRYASRGGEKLETAIEAFGVDLDKRVVLDAGASTGGFTDCLLRHGAAKVYAVDVGFGQLLGRLRADQRVVNMERRNLGSLSREELHPVPTLVTLDLSYLSLSLAVPLAGKLLSPTGELICLVKPLFEIEGAEHRRSGSIDSSSDYIAVLTDVAAVVVGAGFEPSGLIRSPILGNRGSVEFFYHLRRTSGSRIHSPGRIRAMIEALEW